MFEIFYYDAGGGRCSYTVVHGFEELEEAMGKVRTMGFEPEYRRYRADIDG